VRGAAPGARVLASTSLRTNSGRDVPWSTFAWAGPDGVATLRLPYATGLNGAVEAAPWTLEEGKRTQRLVVSERSVTLGEPLEVRLTWPPGAARPRPPAP
jgi:hypothetical protein